MERYYHEFGKKGEEDYYDFYCSFPNDVVVTRSNCEICKKMHCLTSTPRDAMLDLERKVERERDAWCEHNIWCEENSG